MSISAFIRFQYVVVVALFTLNVAILSTADVNLPESVSDINPNDHTVQPDTDSSAHQKIEEFASNTNADDDVEEIDSDATGSTIDEIAEAVSEECIDEYDDCEVKCIIDKRGFELLTCLTLCLRQYYAC